MKTRPVFEITYQLTESATAERVDFGGQVDFENGVIRSATVAKLGVAAKGHYLWLDKDGKQTNDPSEISREIPIVTDAKTLSTLMDAARANGGKFKVRSDHDDSIGSRAGYADNFELLPDRVTCSLHLNTSYRHRDIVLEVAKETPHLIGLSIDFTPTFEVTKDRALMRVTKLTAVDIVDAGAITPEGLLMGEGVDNSTSNKATIMDKELSDAFKATNDAISALASGMTLFVKTQNDKDAAMKAAADAEAAKLAAKPDSAVLALAEQVKTMVEGVTALKNEVQTMRAERSALGLKDKNAGGTKAAAGSDDSTADKGGSGEKPKTYRDAYVEIKTSRKLSASDAHTAAMKEHPELYKRSLQERGIVRANAD